jgi:hypothetical protein
MAFSEPTIHDVQSIKARADTDLSWNHSCLILSFKQSHRYELDDTGRLEIYADKQTFDKFQKLADAINEIFAEPIGLIAPVIPVADADNLMPF